MDSATLSVGVHLNQFPAPELRREAPWSEIQLSEFSPSSLQDVAIVPVNKSKIIGVSLWQTVIVIANVTCIMLLNSMLGGLLVVGLPAISTDLELKDGLLIWPVCVTMLTCGCTLLIFGSVSDVIGPRRTYTTGCLLMTGTTIACALARTGVEFILFRAIQGLALSLCLPSAVQLITSNIPAGTRRNIAFATLGAGQPVGFALGLVLGGVFVESIGWRYGYWIGAGVTIFVLLLSIVALPSDCQAYHINILHRLRTEVDWIGCIIISMILGFSSYVLSVLATGPHNIVQPLPLVLTIISILLIPLFVFYIRTRSKTKNPSLFPASLWESPIFTSLCLTILLTWAVFLSLQIYITLYWQLVAHHSTMATSLQFLPMVVSGVLVNFLSGHLVKRVPAYYLVLAATIVTAVAPLLLALMTVGNSYWTFGFWATALSPVAVDVLFPVSNLVITAAFEDKMHGVAGGVLNTVLNVGQSFGLSISAVVAQSVTMSHHHKREDALLDSYRVVFWVCFGGSLFSILVVVLGLKGVGKVGTKCV